MDEIIDGIQVIDDFLKETFSKELEQYSGDEYFFHVFSDYFKTKLFGKAKAEDIFLTQDEKSFQYTNQNLTEVTAEYDLLILKSSNDFMREHYAEQGANHCIVKSVIFGNQNKKWLRNRARGFYHSASKYTQSELNQKIYIFLEEQTKSIANGLEELLFTLINGSSPAEIEKKMQNYAKQNGLFIPLKEKNYFKE